LQLLVVGGGGSGGTRRGTLGGGGGGGAGAFRTESSFTVTPGNSISILVGGGGAAQTATIQQDAWGFDGNLSYFSTDVIARGGGGGGAYCGGADDQTEKRSNAITRSINGRLGGSGGGGGRCSSSTGGAALVASYGNAGGSANATSVSGGGGGKGSAGNSGGAASNPGKGGDGATSTITGSTVTYAGGGGGSGGIAALGGSSIGGTGARENTSAATAGTSQTGSGGGGGYASSGAGGSGVVIVRYAATLNVTFDSQSGSPVASTTVNFNATLSEPTPPTRAGYDLTGWSLTRSGSVVAFPFVHGQSNDFTLYAIWTRNASCLPTTTIVNGGTVVTINVGIQTTSCSTTWTVPSGVTRVEALIVGGGGGAGGYFSGGGGGGGVTTGFYSVTAGSTLNVTVGGGGAGAYGILQNPQNPGVGADGSASSISFSGGSTYNAAGGSGSRGCTFTSATSPTPSNCRNTNAGGAGGNNNSGSGGAGLGASGSTGTVEGLSSPQSGVLGFNTNIAISGGKYYGSGGDGSGASNGEADTGQGGFGTSSGQSTGGSGAAGVVIFRYSDTAPSTTGSFTLTSDRRVGQSVGINANSVSTSGRVVTTTYQWQKATSGSYSDISGATSSTYTILSADYGATLRLVITYANSGGSTSVSATSSSVLYAAPTISAASFTGTTTVGNTLTAAATTAGSGTTLTYQWYRSDTQSGTYSAIASATSSTYTTVSGDATKWIKVTITVTNDGGTESLTSAASQITGIQLSTPTAPTVSATSGSTTSITVSFTSVANATSYTVRVFQGGSLVGSARTSFTSGSTITGLSPNTAYTVTLTAIGNGTSYTDSETSTAASVTTNEFPGSALTPEFDGVESTLDGFTTNLKNYDSNFTYTFALTNGALASINSSGVVTVTNLAPGESSALTITTTRTSYPSASASISGTSISLKTVTFNANGGTGTMSAQSGRTSATLNSNTFTRQYYNFLRWNTESNGTGTDYEDLATFDFSRNLSLYALWNPISLTITYDSQGGTPVSNGATTYLGKIATAPTPPTRSGYTFLGWSTTPSGSVIAFGGLHNQNSNFTLYAIWSLDTVAPTITSQPTSATKYAGQAIDFTVVATASDSGTLSYQWKKNGTDISGAITATYSINSVTSGDAGSYTVVVTNTNNGTTATSTSNAAILTFATATQLSTPSAPTVTATSGSTTSITISFSSDANASSYTVKVFDSGVLVGTERTNFASGSAVTGLGASTTYTVTVTAIGDGTIYSDSAASSASSVTTNAVAVVATISSQPTSASKLLGQSVSFSVTATASDGGSLTYQWSKGGTAISGATSSTYTIASVSSGDLGNYTVAITNSKNGTTATRTSDIAALTIDSSTNTITFATISNKSYGDTFSVTVSASSGLTVTVSSSTTSVCTVSTLSVTAISLGTCTLVASQAGNGTYPAATSVTRSFTVGKKSLVITASDQNGTVGNSTVAPSYSQSGLVSGDAIGSLSYTYAGSGTTRYTESSSAPEQSGKWILGTYKITPKSVTLSSGSIGNYSVTFVQGTLNVSGSSQKGITGISVKSIGLNKSTELLTGFSASTTSYAIYVESAVTGVTVVISRDSGSLSNAQVAVNDSGFRKLTFTSNAANSGILALPQQSNTITVKMIATDLSVQTYSISILRDQATSSATGGVATPTPTATPRAATQVISSTKFFVNSAIGDGSIMLEISMTPTFSTSTFNYTLNFTKAQSTTLMRTMFSDPGLTIRIKINQSAFRTIPSSGASTSLPLNTGANTAILRVASSDGTVADYTFTLNRAAT
jgi:uncharacterized repeat protein (TIGR02543 family)